MAEFERAQDYPSPLIEQPRKGNTVIPDKRLCRADPESIAERSTR
jgi:hypothetical protein